MIDAIHGVEIDDAVISVMLEATLALPDPRTEPGFDSVVRTEFLHDWDANWKPAWTELMNRTPEDDLEFELAEVHVADFAIAQGLPEDVVALVRLKLGIANLIWLAQSRFDDRYRVRLKQLKSEHGPRPHRVIDLMEFQYYCESTDTTEVRRQLLRAREVAKEDEFAARYSLLHTIAEMTAQLYEHLDHDRWTADDRLQLAEGQKTLAHAMEIYRAEHGRDYPKYYYTRARLALLQGDFDLAEESVKEAIRLEAPTSQRAILRMGQYQIFESKVGRERKLSEHESQINNHLKKLDAIKTEFHQLEIEIRDQAERQQGRTLEILGLLAAIIAFLVIGTSTALQLTNPRMLLLSFAAIGATITAVFATYRLLFVFDTTDARYALDLKRDQDGNVVLGEDGQPERVQVNRITLEDQSRQRRSTYTIIGICVAVIVVLALLAPTRNFPGSDKVSGTSNTPSSSSSSTTDR